MLNFSKLAALAKMTHQAAPPATVAAPDQSDADKLSRRAALRRIGMTGGLSVLGLLTIDDLARLSANKLAQAELTRGLAADLRSAGVAFADHYPSSPPAGPFPSPGAVDPYPECNGNCSCIGQNTYNDCINQGRHPLICQNDQAKAQKECDDKEL